MPPWGTSDHVWRHYCVTPGGKGAVAPSRWRGTGPGCSPHHRVYPAPNVNKAEVEKPDVVKNGFWNGRWRTSTQRETQAHSYTHEDATFLR